MHPRVHTRELLDAHEQDPAELAASLHQVAQVNRRFGGRRALARHLEPLLDASAPIRMLDVGTGNGETAAEVAAWSVGLGAPVRVTGLDLHAGVMAVARSREDPNAPALVRGDGLALPFRDGSFDVVACTLTLHHFDDDDAVALVREMARVARRAVLVNDLERHPLNYLSARMLSWTLWRGNRITRNDGPLSVRRSFTAAELLAVGRRAGLAAPRVRRHFPYRLVLEGGPPGPAQDGPRA